MFFNIFHIFPKKILIIILIEMMRAYTIRMYITIIIGEFHLSFWTPLLICVVSLTHINTTSTNLHSTQLIIEWTNCRWFDFVANITLKSVINFNAFNFCLCNINGNFIIFMRNTLHNQCFVFDILHLDAFSMTWAKQ